VAQIAEAVERIAPFALAEEWDNCGLQVGDPEAEANRVLVALTPLPEVFEEEKGESPLQASAASAIGFHELFEFFLGWQGAHGAVVGAGEGACGAAHQGRLVHPVFFQRSV
jgi:hypothetical protein